LGSSYRFETASFIVEGAVEEGGEEVLSLTQRLSLHGTQTLYSLSPRREVLLELEWGHGDGKFGKFTILTRALVWP
jgi:hypothetical protein